MSKYINIFILFYLLFHFDILISQVNLVPNPSFEEYYHCPDTTNGYFITTAKDWFMPTQGTSDYFNSCSTEIFLGGSTPFKVPNNYMGYQNARTGNAYAGFYYQNSFPQSYYAEYIEVRLTQPLLAKQKYTLKFYISNATALCFNSIGCYFSINPIILSNNSDLLPYTAQAQSNLNTFLCDTLSWQELSFEYIAEGQEEYITIGTFTPMTVKDYQGQIQTYPNIHSYLYIDDISLIEEGEIANVFTPNGDGVNDVIFFGNNSKEVCIYNRWGIKVYGSTTLSFWDGETNSGEKANDGVYFYVVEYTNSKGEQAKKNGYVSLFR